MNAQLFAKLSGIYHVPRAVTDHCNGMFFRLAAGKSFSRHDHNRNRGDNEYDSGK